MIGKIMDKDNARLAQLLSIATILLLSFMVIFSVICLLSLGT